MPSSSKRQKKAMCAAAHNKEIADNMGIDQKVAQEWCKEDQKRDQQKSKGKSSNEHHEAQESVEPFSMR